MTREEAIEILQGAIKKPNTKDGYLGQAIDMAIKALEQEPCEDCISRAKVIKILDEGWKHNRYPRGTILSMPSVIPQEPRKGKWLRMSDLSEQEDDRYKCSRCGNVIHYKNEMILYTFNSWCGRCGSDNGRHINCEVEE